MPMLFVMQGSQEFSRSGTKLCMHILKKVKVNCLCNVQNFMSLLTCYLSLNVYMTLINVFFQLTGQENIMCSFLEMLLKEPG